MDVNDLRKLCLKKYIEQVFMTNDLRNKIKSTTREQAKTILWFSNKKGKLSASNCKSIFSQAKTYQNFVYSNL